MNDFEKYLQKNKHKLEPDGVDAKVWLAVENKMLKDSNKRTNFYIKAFLVALVLLIGGYLAYQANKKAPLNEEKIIAALDLTKYNFAQQISDKKQQLAKATVPQDKLESLEILLHQLEFMDGQFQDYRLYIEQNGYQEFIGEQILNFYKTKIELLDRIQQEVEKINYYERIEPSVGTPVVLEI